jgi:predicted nucleic acid-binding protein
MTALVDTSVWVDFLNGRDSLEAHWLRDAIAEALPVVVPGLVLTEILRGCAALSHLPEQGRNDRVHRGLPDRPDGDPPRARTADARSDLSGDFTSCAAAADAQSGALTPVGSGT